MPSINRPAWRGVTTSSEQSTLNYITESLRTLERSTTLMRENLSNLVGHQNEESVYIEINVLNLNNPNQNSNSSASNLKGESDLPQLDKITQEVQEVLDRNKELKTKVQEAIESNASFKQDIQNYLKQSSEWRQEFAEESKRMEIELQAVIVHKNNASLGVDPDLGDPTCGVTQKVKTWWSEVIAGIVAKRHFLSSWKQRWNNFSIVDTFSEIQIPNLYYDNRIMQY